MLTILVIDDSEDDAFLLFRALSREGIGSSVQRVNDGKDAIRYLQGEDEYTDRKTYPIPNIIFTDLKMPGLDGFGVLNWVKKDPQCQLVPTMVFSASNQEEDVVKAYRLGANAYLVKPGTMSELQKLVRTAYDFWVHCARPKLKFGT